MSTDCASASTDVRPPAWTNPAYDHWPEAFLWCTYRPCSRERSPAARLALHRQWIEWGWFSDLASAHAADLSLYRRWLAEERGLVRHDYRDRQKAREGRAFRFHRALLFAWPRRCSYCGARATCADHVIPQCKGGRSHLDNLTPACGRCNRDKSGRTPVEWMTWRLATGRPWPPAGAVWTATVEAHLTGDTR